MDIPHEQQEKLKTTIESIKGRPFTMKTSSGKKYLVSVQGIKNNYVVMKAVPPTKGKNVKSRRGFRFFLPFLFFLPFIIDDFDLFD